MTIDNERREYVLPAGIKPEQVFVRMRMKYDKAPWRVIEPRMLIYADTIYGNIAYWGAHFDKHPAVHEDVIVQFCAMTQLREPGDDGIPDFTVDPTPSDIQNFLDTLARQEPVAVSSGGSK